MTSNLFITEDMFMIFLFYSSHRNFPQNFMHILMHVVLTCLFHLSKKKNGKLSFLDAEVSRKQSKFVTTVYRKPTFRSAYTHFDSFLSMAYKFGMVNSLAYRCFKICSDWTKFHEELWFLKRVF